MRRLILALMVAALATLALAPAALAGPKGTDRPFKATMQGVAFWEFPGVHPSDCSEVTTLTESPGNATHMGKIMSYWSHCPAEERAGDGVIRLVAANGDELWGTYDYGPETCSGVFGPCTFDELMVFEGGTGRFANATGEARVTYGVTPVFCSETTLICLGGALDLGVEWQWWGVLEGWISY